MWSIMPLHLMMSWTSEYQMMLSTARQCSHLSPPSSDPGRSDRKASSSTEIRLNHHTWHDKTCIMLSLHKMEVLWKLFGAFLQPIIMIAIYVPDLLHRLYATFWISMQTSGKLACKVISVKSAFCQVNLSHSCAGCFVCLQRHCK